MTRTAARMKPDRARAVLSADTCCDGPPEQWTDATISHLVRSGGGRLCGGRPMLDPRLAGTERPTCTACRSLYDRAHEALRDEALPAARGRCVADECTSVALWGDYCARHEPTPRRAAEHGLGPAPVAPIPDEVLQITAGVGSVYVIRRVYVGESVTDLIVTVADGCDLNDYGKPGEELLRVAEDADGWLRAAQLVAVMTFDECRREEA